MIKPLTSLRFLFALLVLLSHITYLVKSNSNLLWNFLNVGVDGGVGVSFFFILSGFVITMVYGDRIFRKEINKKGFIFKRIVRVYPLHLITLLFILPYYFYSLSLNGQVVHVANFVQNLFLNIFLLQSFYPKLEVYFSFNSPAWSISTIMLFYLLFPLIIPIIIKYRKANLWGTGILSLLLLLGMAYLNSGLSHYIFYVNPVVRLLDFFIGVNLFLILKDKKLNVSYPAATLLEFGALFIVLAAILFHHHIPINYRYSIYYWPSAVILIAIFYFNKGLVSEFLSCRIAFFLGQISFSFYLIHWQIIRYISGVNNRLGLTNNMLVLILLVCAITIICSSLTYRYIEEPIIRKLQIMLNYRSRRNKHTVSLKG